MGLQRGKRSKEATKKRRVRHKYFISEQAKVNAIVLCFQYQDPLNGEIVWAPNEFEKVVRAILKLELGYEPSYATNHEYGDVLNRFPLTPFPSHIFLQK